MKPPRARDQRTSLGEVVARPSMQSPSMSGLKNVLSDPLDAHMDYERLWAELQNVFKNPFENPSVIPSGMRLEDAKVSQFSKNEYSVDLILDPAPLQYVTRCKYDKAQRWFCETYINQNGIMEERRHTYFFVFLT